MVKNMVYLIKLRIFKEDNKMAKVKRLKKIMEYEKELKNPNLSDNEKTNIMLKIISLEKNNVSYKWIYVAFVIAWVPFVFMVISHLAKSK